jgi:hypothetical protein
MIDKQNILALYNNFEQIKNSIPPSKLKYVHSKTVDNFIFHLEKFSYQAEKQKVYDGLTKYFDYLNNVRVEDAKTSQSAFIEYIHPLTNIYSDYLDFHLAIKPWIMILYAFVIASCLYLFNAPILAYIVGASVLLLLVVRHFYFQKKQKLYSIMY